PAGDINAISVNTDVLHLRISNAGGNIIEAKLPKYPVSVEEKHTPIQILTNDPAKLYVMQSGLSGKDQNKLIYSAPQNIYTLQPNQNTLNVTLTAKTKEGLLITKTLTFTRGSYSVVQTTQVTNKGSETREVGFFNQITRKNIEGSQ